MEEKQQDLEISQDLIITSVIEDKLNHEEVLKAEDRQTIAYRIAEIMTTSKDLYTEGLADILEPKSEHNALEQLSGLRMSFLHLKDLIEEFEESFLKAMHGDQEPKLSDCSCCPPPHHN